MRNNLSYFYSLKKILISQNDADTQQKKRNSFFEELRQQYYLGKEWKKEKPLLLRYNFAFISVLIVLLLKYQIHTYTPFDSSPFLFFFLATIISAFYGGFGSALFAIILSVVASAFFYDEPLYQLLFRNASETWRIAMFVLQQVIIAGVIDIMQTTRNALLTSENHYRIMMEEASDSIMILDLDGTILEANQKAVTLFGYTNRELLAMNFFDLFEENIKSNLKLPTLSKNKISISEKNIIKKNKSALVVEGTIRLLSDGTVLSTLRDVTSQKELDSRKDEFISMASHELKTPVTSLKIYTQGLKREFESSHVSYVDPILSKMDSQIDKLTRLIRDLLDVSRIAAGKMTIKKEAFSVSTLIQDIFESYQTTTSKHTFIIENKTSQKVFADRDRIGQVIINLVTNAIKYSPKGGKIIAVVKEENGYVNASISDSGIGIDKMQQKKIFDRFYQVSDPEVKTYPGLGMGLYISYEIVKSHQGTLTVESEKGKGSTFSIRLPIYNESMKYERDDSKVYLPITKPIHA